MCCCLPGSPFSKRWEGKVWEKLDLKSGSKDSICDRFLPQLPPGGSLGVSLFLDVNAISYCHLIIKHALFAYLTLLISLHSPPACLQAWEEHNSNSKRKAFFEKNLSLIVCSCNRRHQQLKSLGSGSAQMKRPRADLMISHLGGTKGRGASVWNFLSQQLLLQKWLGSQQGWCGLSSSDVSSGRVLGEGS